jgi:hypothetical protein
MSYPLFGRVRKTPPFALLFLGLAGTLQACACGCQIFDLGLSDMPTTYNPDRLTLQYSFMDQNENQSGSSPASPALNPDKENESSFYTVSLAHQFNDTWGLSATLPYLERRFTTDVNGTPNLPDPSPAVQSQTLGTLGDASVMGMYTGFSEDMAIGLEFGLKLPTGPFRGADWIMDRDTAPGTGTTDLLIGAFDRGQFSADWGWYGQTLLDAPLCPRRLRTRQQPGHRRGPALRRDQRPHPPDPPAPGQRDHPRPRQRRGRCRHRQLQQRLREPVYHPGPSG